MKLALLILLTSLSSFASDVRIDHDASDCTSGWISMDVEVSVDGERFEFDPSCSFSFDDSFTTKAGHRCEIHAGMCSSFSPKNRIEVSCEDGGSDKVNVSCP